ncbi:hypothetical protein MTO96_006175 [Rhipicephalus appendiculatus]
MLTLQSATKLARNSKAVKQQQTEIRRKEHPTVAVDELRELVLDNNELRDASEFRFNAQLATLSLNKNCFDNLDYLVSCIEQCYPSLTFLSLLGNPACPDQISNPDRDDDDDYQRYRYYVIHKLRQLKFLDSRAVTSGERAEALRVGAFMRVARPPAARRRVGTVGRLRLGGGRLHAAAPHVRRRPAAQDRLRGAQVQVHRQALRREPLHSQRRALTRLESCISEEALRCGCPSVLSRLHRNGLMIKWP